MKREGDAIVFDDLLAWAPESAFCPEPEEPVDGRWLVMRGQYHASSGLLLFHARDQDAPELSFDPGLSGWHDVYVRFYHGTIRGGDFGIHVGTSKDRALRLLRPELSTEEFEDLYLGPRDMTGARMRLDGSYTDCYVDSVRLVPRAEPAGLPEAEKEVCAILDFPDAPDDYRPMEVCAAECVRVHAEAGFTTLFWKSFAVRCEYHTKIGEIRPESCQPHMRVNIGTLLQTYDTLNAAVAEAKGLGLNILGWMRINNEFTAGGKGWGQFWPTTPFHKAHPDLRKRYKNGELAPKLSFAYPEVRDYLCSLGREILDRGMDGLMIDVLRHPPMALYDKPLVDAFIEQTGQNPMAMDGHGTEEWLRFRCRAFTDLLRDFRRMMDHSEHKDKPIYVRTMPQPWRNLRDGCDIDAWLREGLVDTIVAGHHVMVSPGHVWQLDLEPMKQLIDGRARLVAQVMRNTEMPVALENARRAYAQDADGVAIYESNDVVTHPTMREAIKRLRSRDI